MQNSSCKRLASDWASWREMRDLVQKKLAESDDEGEANWKLPKAERMSPAMRLPPEIPRDSMK